MISIIKTKCKSNTYEEMGSHTGFKYITRTCDNLVVGKWYELEFNDDVNFGLYQLIEGNEVGSDTGKWINGYNIGTQFTAEKINGVYRFSNFFLSKEESIEELRDLKIKEILKSN
jgi:hypothetical protein